MDKEIKMIIGAIVALILLAIVGGFVQAKMESDTYNRLTGAHTTWWDACWVELRVMDAPRSKE